jgi:hypothetical protein
MAKVRSFLDFHDQSALIIPNLGYPYVYNDGRRKDGIASAGGPQHANRSLDGRRWW